MLKVTSEGALATEGSFMFLRCHSLLALSLGIISLFSSASTFAHPHKPHVRVISNKPVDREAVHQQLTAVLELPGDFEFIETPLSEVAAEIGSQYRINIVLDKTALNSVGIGADTPLTFFLRGVSLRSALRYSLKQLELVYEIENEVILVTTPVEAESNLKTVLYQVSDLVNPNSELGTITDPKFGEFDLVESWIQGVDPESWDEVGGPGDTMRAILARRCFLIVSNTEEVHEQVSLEFARMRRILAPDEKPIPAEATVVRSYPLSCSFEECERVANVLRRLLQPDEDHGLEDYDLKEYGLEDRVQRSVETAAGYIVVRDRSDGHRRALELLQALDVLHATPSQPLETTPSP